MTVEIVGDEPISLAALLAARCCSLAQVVISTATRTFLASHAISVPSPVRYRPSSCFALITGSGGDRERLPTRNRPGRSLRNGSALLTHIKQLLQAIDILQAVVISRAHAWAN